VTASAAGLVKRTTIAEIAGSRQRSLAAAGIKDGDELVAARLCRENDELVMAHDGGMAIRFAAATVRPMGRTAAGVAGIRTDGARVIALGVIGADGGTVVSVSSSGVARRFALDELSATGRGGKGLRVGDQPLAWFGPRADLHLTIGGEPTVLRGEELVTGRRTGKGTPLGGTIIGVVTAESTDEDGLA
jgi:DNA gyrase/topoisomerase IV subunit A